MRKLTLRELCMLTGLKYGGMVQKAKRQQWPFEKDDKTAFYPFETLPDKIQTAWAVWDDESYSRALNEQRNKSERRQSMPPPAVTRKAAESSLALPVRDTYFIPKTKLYDGVSSGLCVAAQEILLKRFPKVETEVARDPDPEVEAEYRGISPAGKEAGRVDFGAEPSVICPDCDFGAFKRGFSGKFCPICGGGLIGNCSNCGAEPVNQRQNFCIDCGLRLRRTGILPKVVPRERRQ